MQTEKLQDVIEKAYVFARQLGVQEVKAEHVLFELANVESHAKAVLA